VATRIERALVTGASAGIGEEFARQLAARGVAADPGGPPRDRLEALASELDVEVEVLPADLLDPAGLASVEATGSPRRRPIDLLVNNAGFGLYGDHADLDIERQQAMIELNVLALTRLARAALDQQVQRGAAG
jgi:uncharacterized protein